MGELTCGRRDWIPYFCMYFKSGTPTKADGKRKEGKMIEKKYSSITSESVSLLVSLRLR